MLVQKKLPNNLKVGITCHSSASLVTLPVDVVDSGPEPGGRELVGGIELHDVDLYKLPFECRFVQIHVNMLSCTKCKNIDLYF